MKSTKLTIKIVLVISLFCSVALAEGDMGSGGRSCPQGTTCLIANPTNANDKNQTDSKDSFLVIVRDFLTKIFG